MDENAISREIVDAAFRVHTALGPGLFESVYEAALAYELEKLVPVHRKQLLTYLRLANRGLGLLINLNVALIKDGITRVANGL